jgi:hypothetical protein
MIQLAQSETAPAGISDSAGEVQHRRVAKIACGFGIFAAVMFALFTIRLVLPATAVPAESYVLMRVAILAAIIVTLLLSAGTVAMRARQPIGQVLLIVASALGIAYAVSFTVYNYFHGPIVYGEGDLGTVVVQVLLGVIPALVALVCTAIAASERAANR